MTKNIFKDVFTLSLFFYSFWIDGDKISVYAKINFIAMQRYREGFDTLYEISQIELKCKLFCFLMFSFSISFLVKGR